MNEQSIWIATPSFRSLAWLPSCVASVADQAVPGIKVYHHIQDGGSDDGTREWLEEYAAKCRREPRPGYTFSFECAKDNGMYDAINKAWSKAPNGIDFLAHLNSDEQYLPGALQTVVDIFAKKPKWEVLLAGMIVIDAKSEYICHRYSLAPSRLIFRYVCGGMTAATFQRASVFQKRGICFETGWRMISDKIWYLQMIESDIKIVHCNRLVSTFMETGENLGWSPTAVDERQRYADRFLEGKLQGMFFFQKLNGLRRMVKEWFVKPPTGYAIYTQSDPQQRRTFSVENPTFRWGKYLKMHSSEETSDTAADTSQTGTAKGRKILITEAHTDANVGSGALVENAVQLLRERFPDARIKVAAIFPEAFSASCNVESVVDPYGYPYKKPTFVKIKWAIKTLFWMGAVRMQVRPGCKAIRFYCFKVRNYLWADWVVSVHAERIKESFHVDPLFTLFSFHIAHLLGKKVILFPCTLGPYGLGTKMLVDRWLREVDLLYTRDDISFQLAHEAKGMDPKRIVACADVAVVQKAIGKDEALALIGCDPRDQLVGISVMRWRYIQGNLSKYSNYRAYVLQMAKVADHLITTYGVKVVIYPTNYAIRGCTTEDREAVRDIYDAAECKARIVKIEQFLSPSELKGALACSEVNITTRMHACIFSTGAGVPTLSVNYLYKLREYMNSLGLGDYAIDIEDFNAEWMKAAFAKMWNRRPEIRQLIEARIKEKQGLLKAGMDLLLKLE